MKRRVVVALVSMLLGVGYVVAMLANNGWDPTVFGAFADDHGAAIDFAEARLGPVYTRPGLGHDGKFFFIQAHDPFVTWLVEERADLFDRPAYRAQRMLFPVLLWAVGLGRSWGILWALPALSVVSIGVAAYALAELAIRHGASPWVGLAAPLNLGLLYELDIGGAGVLATALGFVAVALLTKGRAAWAIAVLTAAVLTREAMLVVVAGLAAWAWLKGRRADAARIMVVPLAAALAWAVYVRSRLGSVFAGEVGELDWPFRGLWRVAIGAWPAEPIELVGGVFVLAVMALFVWRALTRRDALAWACAGFVPLALILSDWVWYPVDNVTRAIAPVISAVVYYAFTPVRPDEAVPVTPGAAGRGLAPAGGTGRGS